MEPDHLRTQEIQIMIHTKEKAKIAFIKKRNYDDNKMTTADE